MKKELSAGISGLESTTGYQGMKVDFLTGN